MQSSFRLLMLAFVSCLCAAGCSSEKKDALSKQPTASNPHQPFHGIWSDSFDDHAFVIHVSEKNIQIVDAPFSRWESTFSDIKVIDGALAFTQSSDLKNGEYHPVNGTSWNVSIRLSDQNPDIGTITTVSLYGDPLGTGEIHRRKNIYGNTGKTQ